MSLLSVQNLTVTFGMQTVLRDISFDISAGETLAVIGESGCGKTVLLKTLIDLIQPTWGRVVFEGTELGKQTETELAKIRMNYGFVFQMAALFDSMTIEENLLFPMVQHTKQSRQEMMGTMLKLLEEVGLSTNILQKHPAELSGGMRKRVGIARALVLHPKIVLYDEPTTGLDPIMTDVINRLMQRMAETYAITSVIVTHDMTTVRNVADRVIMLYPTARLKPKESQILYDGPAKLIEVSADKRIHNFVFGDGSERLNEV